MTLSLAPSKEPITGLASQTWAVTRHTGDVLLGDSTAFESPGRLSVQQAPAKQVAATGAGVPGLGWSALPCAVCWAPGPPDTYLD